MTAPATISGKSAFVQLKDVILTITNRILTLTPNPTKRLQGSISSTFYEQLLSL
jgi:hypothetical protein